MGVSFNEQETTITIMRDENIARICTSDLTMKTKLDHRVEQNPDEWKKTEENEYFTFYECPKKFVSFRSKSAVGREMTEEEKQAAAERLEKYRRQKQQDFNSEPEF